MTARRLPATKPGPRLENQRGEEVVTPCYGNPEPYDVLHDYFSGPQYRTALAAAREMCGRCPIAAKCLRDNRDEVWAQAVTGRKAPTVTRETCGTLGGYTSHRYRNEQPCAACNKANARRTAGRREVAA